MFKYYDLARFNKLLTNNLKSRSIKTIFLKIKNYLEWLIFKRFIIYSNVKSSKTEFKPIHYYR